MGLINLHVVCELLAHKAKGCFLIGSFIAMVKYHVTIMKKVLFSNGLLNDTILLSLSH